VTRFDTVEHGIAEIAAGRAVVVVDDADRENEGDLIFAASKVTPDLVGFMVRYTSGVICVAMEGPTLDRLELPPMAAQNQERRGTAYTVSVDAREGISTGISAADRALTIRTLADSATEPHELSRPGHVFPLRYREGGVLVRPGHTEAAVDLARIGGLTPAGVLCEITNDDGTMARLPELGAFARKHGLALISIADLIAYRRRLETQVLRMAEARLPTRHGEFRAVGYRNVLDGSEHVALLRGDVGEGDAVLVRVHSECLTGDVFGSQRCDCGMQLDAALEVIATEGRGILLYVRGHEGRGIGLLHKLQAYQLQDRGRDTVDANLDLGLPADARDYGTGAQILVDLGVRTMRLITNNPTKRAALEGFGLEIVDRVPLPVTATPENLHYLQTKRDRMGHELPDLPVTPPHIPAVVAPPTPATPLRSGFAGIVAADEDAV
jgi:3,4-dihydroxy 2-butanone 4-phosphate synthase / GTP cyclohydrolase II